VKITKNENEVIVEPVSENDNAMWGTTRAVIQNMVL
jgi:ribosomal protein L6P/L9E